MTPPYWCDVCGAPAEVVAVTPPQDWCACLAHAADMFRLLAWEYDQNTAPRAALRVVE